MTTSTPASAPIGLVSGRPGRVRARVRSMLEESRGIRSFSTEDEVRAALAESYAGAVDRAVATGDTSKLLTAGAKLTELLDTLPIRRLGGEEDGDDDGADPRAKLYAVMDGPPSVGDSSHG